ncbi:MAG: methionine--tRNA ligase, partial [Sulfolobales archaeon]
PITPNSAEKLFKMLNLSIDKLKLHCDETPPQMAQHKIGRPEPLFKKLDSNFLKNIDAIISEARHKAQLKRPDVLKW